MSERISIFWFRRDLRLHDNCGLYHALQGNQKVLPIFIFDRNILDDLTDKSDARITFIHQRLQEINHQLSEKGSGIKSFYGSPLQAFQELTKEYSIEKVYCNHDYEPYAIQRDQQIGDFLKEEGIEFETFKDQVIFEKSEVIKDNGTPYLVYTPYSRKWLARFAQEGIEFYPSESISNWEQLKGTHLHTLEEMGFSPSSIEIPKAILEEKLIRDYEHDRDFPAKNKTSRIGVHLRFGTVSIRRLVDRIKDQSLVFLKELIWREFFMMILYHYPKVVDHNFNSKYDGIQWRNKEEDFEKWKKGETGYPLVDAGMRELNASGFMHNRVRMVVASFLCKHLLIDWKWGEAYFAQKLLDYELSANNGNWQWAAGTGVDAAPYFRVFNPEAQLLKFDKQLIYTRKWVDNFDELSYPQPMVDHASARNRAIATYKEGLAVAN